MSEKPTSLLMKYLYTLILETGGRPNRLLPDLTYHEAMELAQRLKKQLKQRSNAVQNKARFHEEAIRAIDTSDHKELDWIGNQLSLFYFGRPCRIPIEWDKSLKNMAGCFMFDRFTLKPIKILQSQWQYTQFGAMHVLGTLKHELAHYHLFIQGKPFRDGEEAFILECQRIGAPLYALAMQEGYETSCSSCGKYHGIEKKIKKKHKSGCCKQSLNYGSYILRFPDGLRVEVEK